MRHQDVAHGAGRTQNDKLFAALERGEGLTPYTALQIAGSLRLSQRIIELERDGVPIEREKVKVGKAHVMSYRMGRLAHG